ncbi:A-kinase anchor protein SPHKAP isoform X1 [Trichosurus vulpecula]|uniref:A-kinase anchor protein SPHKAP isoform X1 n=1 Tax=Trichosurus vulpecula TaxID=9337 RepID=UPI00186B4CAA|nr:A-kinase anchor protein SPHKAP isoform X1 [Trichosurus vulpecula]
MAGNSLLTVPSNFESSLMHEVSEQQCSGTESSGSSLGSSVTACKKVLCSNSLLESTDYWLQNQRTPCQIGFVEDKSENCASVCFVNLDVTKEDCSNEHLRQKLVNVSPDLPKFINSMNVQQPKENEIVLLSGLSSGNLHADFEVSKYPWLPDICLVQCARGNRQNSTNCIIFEINKFLIGLELVQERQLHLENSVFKVEDDTNCSVSSIEEDFLTASEHLEDESEVEEYKNGYENVNVSVNVSESKKSKGATQGDLNCKKGKLRYAFEENYICKDNSISHKSSRYLEGTLRKAAEIILPSTEQLAQQLQQKGNISGEEGPATSNFEESSKGRVESSHALQTLGKRHLDRMVKEELTSVCDNILKHNGNPDPEESLKNEEQESLPPLQDEGKTTGEYATNLAESVLQDAFIRLSQSQPTCPMKSVANVPIKNALISEGCTAEDTEHPRPWQELPKIVIVQSPDSSEAISEWPGTSPPNLSHWTQSDPSAETSGELHEEKAIRPPQSALEVALACAATVIGTISSPQATERFRLEQETSAANGQMLGNEELQRQVTQTLQDGTSMEYSFPSALCGMTQVASAVAVCGLGETQEDKYPVASSGLLSAAEASAAVTLHGSVAMGSNMETLNKSIAEALLKEASMVLTKPNSYSSIGSFMESMNGRIIETMSRPQISCLDKILRDDLAEDLSNVILKHSLEEANRKKKMIDGEVTGDPDKNTQDILMETVNELLFNAMYFTFKKMSNITQFSEHPPVFSKENNRWRGTEIDHQLTETAAAPRSPDYSNSGTINNWYNADAVKDLVDITHPKRDNNSRGMPNIFESSMLQSELPFNNNAHNSTATKTSPKKRYPKQTTGDYPRAPNQRLSHNRNGLRSYSDPLPGSGMQELMYAESTINPDALEKRKHDSLLNTDIQVNLSPLGSNLMLPSQPMPQVKHSTDNYCVIDFAEELAETVVSMATEIAAICLDNSNRKQPWFCAWKGGNEYLMTPSLSCRTLKRKKESQANGSIVRKHKPPRLSEIKRKTDEHPELKERLMNRVMDESVNLDDVPDSVNIFANEVAAKIMNLTEFSMVDGIWQAQNHPRNRLLGERLNRVRASSSCESIPEEDSDSRGFVNSLGLMNTLSQPVSRASSVSKQSSCESITDEFSRFMVNQMENEGRGFDLLLDYYAGRNASTILTSALQQVSRKNGHLSVKPSCPSKQSSTESITEEFYRYMLRDLDRESKDSISSSRSNRDWGTSLLPPSPRYPFCYRQFSVPENRSSCAKLTVNAPVKANSLDGFAQNGQQDFLSIQPVSNVSSSGLCKSDSCLYQRGRTDQITSMLIHETWTNSIQALMQKNKIIADETEATDADPVSRGSPCHVKQYANRLGASIEDNGNILLVVHQDSSACTNKDSVTENRHLPTAPPDQPAPPMEQTQADFKKEHFSSHDTDLGSHTGPSSCLREVPLIQIETDQRDDLIEESETILSQNICTGEAKENDMNKEKDPEMDSGRNTATSSITNNSADLNTEDAPDPEISVEVRAQEESLNPQGSSSSDESTGSWSQLVNDEDNPDDTSSYLQLSERSMSNGNSSTTSSLGIVDLEIYQENMPSSPMINELVEEKECLKEPSENKEECTSKLSTGTASCQRNLLVINFDLEPECPDAELRATLQWIAASELGISTIYFKKSQENRIEKFLDVVQLVHQKAWKVGDIFHAVVQYCKLQEERKELKPSLFDWLLGLG